MRKERKNEALLWFGKWTSKLGNIVFDYANSVSIVGAFSHAPWVLALYQSSETVIQIVFNLIGGAKADSGSRKKILIVTDILAAAICLAVSFFVASPRMAEVVIAANALLAVVYAFNSPTYRSIVREMVDGERIGMYNSVSNGGGEVIKIAGPMVGMLLVRWIGVRGALLFDALTFLLSAVFEMLLTPISDTQRKPAQKKNDVDAELDKMPLGVGIQKWEYSSPLPETPKEMRDIRGTIKNITTWYLGHACKMVGLRNSYCKMYEDAMDELRVKHPEYDEEDDDSLLNDIFGSPQSSGDM